MNYKIVDKQQHQAIKDYSYITPAGEDYGTDLIVLIPWVKDESGVWWNAFNITKNCLDYIDDFTEVYVLEPIGE